ncbi:hypothetical protein GCM10027569_38810 [Flindersiella endophytica]
MAGKVGYSAAAITANADGVIATAEVHFPHQIALWGTDFGPIGRATDFLTSDEVGYAAPSDVQAGLSGDFYGIDQYRLRVLRLQPAGGVAAAYSLAQLGEPRPAGAVGLRVLEDQARLYTAWPSGKVWVSGFDGTPLWSAAARPAGDMFGGFDLDAEGRLHVLSSANLLQIFDTAGVSAGTLTLTGGTQAKAVTGLRVHGSELVVKRADPTTLFEVYDANTGALLRSVPADVERLRVTYPSAVCTAGSPVPLTISFDAGSWRTNPQLRAWIRPLGVPEFRELPVVRGRVTPSADARGLYHLRVSPGLDGRFSDYAVDGVLEVRTPGTTGTVSLFTPLNRFYYGKGEPIPFTVVARTAADQSVPSSVPVRLMRDDHQAGQRAVVLRDGRGEAAFDAAFTAELEPGRYVLDADVPGCTVAPQYLEIGAGLSERPSFHLVQHGDYSDSMPITDVRDPGKQTPTGSPSLLPFADLPETTADHLNRARQLGINLFVDRIGSNWLSWKTRLTPTPADSTTVDRLSADPTAVAPEKAVFEDPTSRAIAGYGAHGIEEQPILLFNDAGLPLGTLYDPRTPENMEADLEAITRHLLPYAAFRGWSWAANWWLAKPGADAAADPAERAAYEAALTAARDTGAWSAVLDTVSDRTFALKVDAERRFRAALESVAPGKLSAMSAPYPSPQTPPAVIFANVDEVDLHYQAEQLQPPQITPHQVDFYKRPGKPAWGHPELGNDDGTGGMFLPTLFQMMMCGADGVGASGDASGNHGGSHAVPLPDWRSGGTGPRPGDPRSGGAGKTSVLRAAYDVFREHGSAVAQARSINRVAIVVSTRMQRIEIWDGQIRSAYFDALFEAYNACLYAHRPAAFVFAEDATAQSLTGFSVVLLVGQRVELDPALAEALQAAVDAGVSVWYDGTCRPELVARFNRLPVTFDRIKNDPPALQDDSAYARFRRHFLDHATALREAWGTQVAPVASCDQPEVMLTERQAGDIRYIWAVNNTLLDWEPGLAWRVSLLITHRVPVMANLALPVPPGHKVLDVLAGKVVQPRNGTITADLRTIPARLYAILPPGYHNLPAPSPALEDRFGPHARDIAISDDGHTALVNCFNWDHNLYGLDLTTGQTTWRRKAGHFFTFAPAAHAPGFTVQGFDLSAAEGYHLYLLDDAGELQRRFALFGLPKRGTDWASGEWGYDLGLNNFAAPPSRSWIATSGDLGTTVWTESGTELWSHEGWPHGRAPYRLLALDESTLITCTGGTISGLSATDGTTLWSLSVVTSGDLLGGLACADGGTAVFWSDTDGGRIFVIRDGELVNTIPAAVDELALSGDGTLIAVTASRQLRVFDTDGGLLWAYTGDDHLRRPRISPDGTRIAVGSELGTLIVLNRTGSVLTERDLQALPVPAWLPGGDLLVATWMGRVMRLNADLTPTWERRLRPAERNAAAGLRAPDPTPTIRKTGWGNATTTMPLSPNLVLDTRALVYAELHAGVQPTRLDWQNPLDLLRDGKTDPPPKPWLPWWAVGKVDSGWHDKLTITVDTFRTQIRLDGITFVEDPAHPESWLRDVRLQWWDPVTETWRDGPYLLSDAQYHSHALPQPVEAARFRFATTGGGGWPSGNIRLGELVFHGQQLGCSHPDVVARRPLAVLFDEQESDVKALVGIGPSAFRYTDAYSGGKCLELKTAGQSGPAYVPPFGHAIPNWNFDITEQPQPGQYRYLQFAWRAKTSATNGMSLLLGLEWPGRATAVSIGDASFPDYTKAGEHTVPGTPSTAWSVVTVDLWAVCNGAPPPIRCLSLLTSGDGAMFDQIVLARTLSDLPNPT